MVMVVRVVVVGVVVMMDDFVVVVVVVVIVVVVVGHDDEGIEMGFGSGENGGLVGKKKRVTVMEVIMGE